MCTVLGLIAFTSEDQDILNQSNYCQIILVVYRVPRFIGHWPRFQCAQCTVQKVSPRTVSTEHTAHSCPWTSFHLFNSGCVSTLQCRCRPSRDSYNSMMRLVVPEVYSPSVNYRFNIITISFEKYSKSSFINGIQHLPKQIYILKQTPSRLIIKATDVYLHQTCN